MRMRIATTAAVAAAGLLTAAAPPVATAATVTTDVPCRPTQPAGETFIANGAGFTPGAPVTFTLNGQRAAGSRRRATTARSTSRSSCVRSPPASARPVRC